MRKVTVRWGNKAGDSVIQEHDIPETVEVDIPSVADFLFDNGCSPDYELGKWETDPDGFPILVEPPFIVSLSCCPIL